MGIAGPWAGYAFYKLTKKLHGSDALAIFLCMVFADFITYVVTSFQLAFAFPDPTGGVWGAAGKFLGIFAITQIPLALIEGFIGILLFRFLAKVATPQLQQLGVLGNSQEVAHA